MSNGQGLSESGGEWRAARLAALCMPCLPCLPQEMHISGTLCAAVGSTSLNSSALPPPPVRRYIVANIELTWVPGVMVGLLFGGANCWAMLMSAAAHNACLPCSCTPRATGAAPRPALAPQSYLPSHPVSPCSFKVVRGCRAIGVRSFGAIWDS